jgi:hypothetical protein
LVEKAREVGADIREGESVVAVQELRDRVEVVTNNGRYRGRFALDRNEGTVLENGLMNTPMRRVGDRFSATVPVPSGAHVDYGFLVTDRRGLFDLVRPLWDSREGFREGATDSRVIDVGSSLTLPSEVTEALWRWRRWAVGLVLLVAFWALFHLAIPQRRTS